MKNPFHLLNLPLDADDQTVVATYERLSALHPKELSPKRAQEIEWAYQTLKEQRDRIRFQLFEIPKAHIPTLLGPALNDLTPTPPTQAALLEVLTNSLKTYRIPMPEREEEK
jgi:hypothetical protein